MGPNSLKKTAMEQPVAYQHFLRDESGAITVDYVVIMAAMVGLGAAISDTTGSALGTHSGNIQGELQGGQFETAWDHQLAVQPDPDAGVDCTDGSSCDPGTGTGGGTTGGGTTGGGTTDPNPDPDPDPTPDPDPDPTPDPDPDPTPDPDPDPVPDPDPDPTPPQSASAPAAGCPSTAYYGVPIVSDGSDFGNSNDYDLRTSGYTNLRSCPGLPDDYGFFDANPSFTLTLLDMEQFNRVQFLIESTTCDTTLLIRDATGTYHFNDDFNYPNHTRSRLRLSDTADLNGRVDIWIGRYSPGTCNSTLEIRGLN